MSDQKPTCETCPFWYEMAEGEGQCRRHAPRSYTYDAAQEVGKKHLVPQVIFPETCSVDWCGEHPDFRDVLLARHMAKEERAKEERAKEEREAFRRSQAPGYFEKALAIMEQQKAEGGPRR